MQSNIVSSIIIAVSLVVISIMAIQVVSRVNRQKMVTTCMSHSVAAWRSENNSGFTFNEDWFNKCINTN